MTQTGLVGNLRGHVPSMLVQNQQQPPTPEESFGRALRRQRIAAQRSQQWVADEMTARGFSWRQSTAAKTEAGERPVRLNEAAALSEVLMVPLEHLLRQDSEIMAALREATTLDARVRDLEHRRIEAEANLTAIARDLDAARAELEKARLRASKAVSLVAALGDDDLPKGWRRVEREEEI